MGLNKEVFTVIKHQLKKLTQFAIFLPAQQRFVILCEEGDGLPLMSSSPSTT